MRRLLLFLMVLGLLAFASPATAQTVIVIELEGIMGRPPGTVELIYTESVDPALVGQTCEAVAQTENNASVHPGNNVIMETGSTSATFVGVEDSPGLIIPGSGPVTLGTTIDIYFEWGEDGITSLGITLTLTCAPPATTTTTTTTTTEPPPTTTEPPPTTTSTTTGPTSTTTTTTSTTTTTQPVITTTTAGTPEGGVGTGAGGSAGSDQFGLVALGLASVALAGAGATSAWRRRSQS